PTAGTNDGGVQSWAGLYNRNRVQAPALVGGSGRRRADVIMPEIRVPMLRTAAIFCVLTLTGAHLPVHHAHAEQPALRQLQPEADTGQSDKSLAIGKTFMVSSANALASE